MFDAKKLQTLIESGFEGSAVYVLDTTGGGDHFEVEVVSNQFEGKSLVDRHRMIYKVVGQAMGAEIHALSLKTLTPNEAGRA